MNPPVAINTSLHHLGGNRPLPLPYHTEGTGPAVWATRLPRGHDESGILEEYLNDIKKLDKR